MRRRVSLRRAQLAEVARAALPAVVSITTQEKPDAAGEPQKGIGSGFSKAIAGIVVGGQTLSLALTLIACALGTPATAQTIPPFKGGVEMVRVDARVDLLGGHARRQRGIGKVHGRRSVAEQQNPCHDVS